MKEIKFRAWHYEEGNPMYVPCMEYSNRLELFFKNVANEPCSVEVMQYTGLKDKNGKEIYEGDIYTANGKNSYQVIFNYGCFCGGKNLNAILPLAWNVDEDDEDFLSGDTSWLEVIGNIYENPELLEGEE